MLTPAQALDTVLEHIRTIGTERISLFEAQNRVVARDLTSQRSLPPCDNAAMDGFAVRAADIAELPARLTVQGTIAAGDDVTALKLLPGHCYRIMTGAFIPAGADTVVEYEITRSEGEQVTVLEPKKLAANIRRAGEDIARGATIRCQGEPVRPWHIARYISAGVFYFSVYRRPRVAVISSGNEIVDPGTLDDSTKTYDSNGPAVAALLRNIGCEVVYLGVSRDDEASLQAMFSDLSGFDAVITSAGISAGDFDMMNRVAKNLGIRWHFQSVSQKPGKPISFGVLHGTTLLFALPGNPISSMFCAYFYLLPAMRKMAGYASFANVAVNVELGAGTKKTKKRTQFDRARLQIENGKLIAYPAANQDSHVIDSMVESNAFLVLEPQSEYRQGDIVAAYVHNAAGLLGGI
ncbi:molybdopterin molybdotransferase MoeA [Chrysiogenes arsenatis]|uniref:molybdopterin molybdotransferase MoeA n=1 Tax=Chrysiogenes arsenatis TaxID=309797 RepID=UPI00041AEABC|nr:gephyrin-like molybdotransferase Glp [Chrysiogenes arsenatis]